MFSLVFSLLILLRHVLEDGQDGLPVSLVFSLVFSLLILLRHVLEDGQDGLPVIKEGMYGITVGVVDNPV